MSAVAALGVVTPVALGLLPPVVAAAEIAPGLPPVKAAEPWLVEVSVLAEADWPEAVFDPEVVEAPATPREPPTPRDPSVVEPGLAWLGMNRAATRIPATNAAKTVAGVRPLRRARRAHASIPPVLLGPAPANCASSPLTDERQDPPAIGALSGSLALIRLGNRGVT
ncbi:MAG TPA: hypothetical protein VNG12_17725 [Acidimicrobiales bacterium]|nr:hypothetical protein [Acidimicrobiales bacterium]